MRHAVFGRKLSRTKNERRRLFQGLARDLIEHGSVQTTLAKAKAVQPLVEKLVTKAKLGERIDIVQISRVLDDRALTQRLVGDAKTRFAGRTSGFTKIVKLGKRLGDATEMVQFSFMDDRVIAEVIKPAKVESADKAVHSKKESAVAQKKKDKKTK
ncbi:50S ribosomal protein L17 [Candidatus Gottesmanbacteria bacterium]|nr:50S ribosomal protein L17 [Candidatus Gottesmanbacteria bacterium]